MPMGSSPERVTIRAGWSAARIVSLPSRVSFFRLFRAVASWRMTSGLLTRVSVMALKMGSGKNLFRSKT